MTRELERQNAILMHKLVQAASTFRCMKHYGVQAEQADAARYMDDLEQILSRYTDDMAPCNNGHRWDDERCVVCGIKDWMAYGKEVAHAASEATEPPTP
jgi:predicted phosphohydrolase